MRIVIDMQGAQTESRFRGIGRYTMSFAEAVCRNCGEHEIFLALSGAFPESILPIREAFQGLLPDENIKVWDVPTPANYSLPKNECRRNVAELIREDFLERLEPDVIHIASLFEGFWDDAVGSIGRLGSKVPTSVMFYDLIPLLNKEKYLKRNDRYTDYYEQKLAYFRDAACFLAISESARLECLSNLDVSESQVVNISTAIDKQFCKVEVGWDAATSLKVRCGLVRPFVLYSGGADERKNLPRLIEAYAALPANVRSSHQLLFAGKVPKAEQVRLQRYAISAGLTRDELLFTGYVTDTELIQLYNLCKLFVFPSWHEGFGLPALEAMSCGAPVIGANSTSLPEVIGLEEALFDPFDVSSISEKLRQGLEDEAFRKLLKENATLQAPRFSWDETARKAVAAWERLGLVEKKSYVERACFDQGFLGLIGSHLKRLNDCEVVMAADCISRNRYSAPVRQLFVDVSELCQNDAATGVQRVVRSYLRWLLESPPVGFSVEPVYATLNKGYCYARKYTQRFIGRGVGEELKDSPITWQRGDLFFGLDMQHHVQLKQHAFYQQLRQDGVVVKFLIYDLLPIQLAEFFKDSEVRILHEQLLSMISTLDGAVSISRTTADVFAMWAQETGKPLRPLYTNDWVHIGADIYSSVPSMGLPANASDVLDILSQRITFLCVSTLEPRKAQRQILDAANELWSAGVDVNLVLVGRQGWKVEELALALREHPERGKRLFWLEGISDEYLELIYKASTCLIAASIDEGFGLSLIEAAQHNLPIIARDIPVFREVAGEHATYFRGTKSVDLSAALIRWIGQYEANEYVKSGEMHWLSWKDSAERLKTVLTEQVQPGSQLFVDVSELVRHDAKTGIQRVVRSVLNEWLLNPPSGYRIALVYAKIDEPYRYANKFFATHFDQSSPSIYDEVVSYKEGDIFVGLDFQPQVQAAQRYFYQKLRQHGVRVVFIVYDLLCLNLPQFFPAGADIGFKNWLQVVVENDAALCISKSVANELNEWVSAHKNEQPDRVKIDWFHLGADIENSSPTRGLPPTSEEILKKLASRKTFLMVGTVEPRKGHAQVLDAFDALWRQGNDFNLVVVGKEGWLVDDFRARVREHPEVGNRLMWLEGVSDEFLEALYTSSDCLIAASYGEGFGLPIIEAANRRIPVIARDIPVFREVAGSGAHFFNAQDGEMLAAAILDWVREIDRKQVRELASKHVIAWKESAAWLLRLVLASRGCSRRNTQIEDANN